MEIIKACPVCGNRSVTPLVRKALLSRPCGSLPSLDDVTVFGYRCANGHLVVVREEAHKEKAGNKPAA